MNTNFLHGIRVHGKGVGNFRVMTREEVLALLPGERVWFLTLGGDARQLKVNGKVRTWKRNPDRIEVPVKYGLYEYGTLEFTQYRLLMEESNG